MFNNIQILRGISALLVVYLHIEPPYKFGNFGVDIFFVISGFVISLVVDKGESVRAFIFNRTTRIIPLYFILTTLVLLATFFVPHFFRSTTFDFVNYAKSILFIPYRKENGSISPMLTVGWTLNYEMYFYSIVLLSIIINRRLWYFLTLALLLLTNIYSAYSEPTVFTEFYSNTILLEFAIGIITYYSANRNLVVNRYFACVIFMTIFIGMAILEITLYPEIITNNIRWLVFGLPSGFLLYISILFEDKIKKNILMKSLVRIGDATYAIYLSHLFLIQFLQIIYTRYFTNEIAYWLYVTLVMISSVGIGMCVNAYIDKPMLNYLKRFA